MTDACAEACIHIHEEIERYAVKVASFIETHYPLTGEPWTEHEIKSGIIQTFFNTHSIPETVMSELVKHTREKLTP